MPSWVRRIHRSIGVFALASAWLVACTTSVKSSPIPSGSAGATIAAPSATSLVTPAPTLTGRASPPNLAALTLSLEPYATVSGGPLAITSPRDGSSRLFVAAQNGLAWVVRDGRTSEQPLLDVRANLTAGGERGLLGIAVHPKFPADPRVFVDYTDANGDTVVASFRIAAGNPDQVDPASQGVILRVDQPYSNHNGGALAFGPDGYLYVSLGDGGSEGDPKGYGQSLTTMLGKILRIDVDHGSDPPYAIPPDNPYAASDEVPHEIWLSGLRNPWRMSFDRATGDLWIGDVGQDAWEEVDVLRAGTPGGANFGWKIMEGAHCYDPPDGCPTAGLTLPITEYDHHAGCSVIGGDVYRGAAYPGLVGAYVFADYCSGNVWAIDAATTQPVPPTLVGTVKTGLAGFGEDESGELYAANLDGTISRVVAGSH